MLYIIYYTLYIIYYILHKITNQANQSGSYKGERYWLQGNSIIMNKEEDSPLKNVFQKC